LPAAALRTTGVRVLLAGGGHSHVEVLRGFATAPLTGASVTVVDPRPRVLYSAMVPGIVAGHYLAAEATIDVRDLARRAGAHYVQDAVSALDLEGREATLASGVTLPFDLIALDVGSVPSLAAPESAHVVATRPFAPLLDAWHRWQAEAARGELASVAVIGGGAAAIELLLAMQFATRDVAPSLRYRIVSDRLVMSPVLERRLLPLLHRRGVDLLVGERAREVREGTIELGNGASAAADRIVVATSASAPGWLAAAGLACDDRGFVAVDATLRSLSHPFVLASGDCAALTHAPRPKAGVFAVRAAPVLARNLRALVGGRSLRRYVPQSRWLLLMTIGERRAIATRGSLALCGAWAWRWKDRIDRGFIRRFAPPARGRH
jgi:selenide,water dikinase